MTARSKKARKAKQAKKAKEAAQKKIARDIAHIMAMGYTPYKAQTSDAGSHVWLRFIKENPIKETAEKGHYLVKWEDIPTVFRVLYDRGFWLMGIKIEPCNKAQTY